jgi:hypothetical protein
VPSNLRRQRLIATLDAEVARMLVQKREQLAAAASAAPSDGDGGPQTLIDILLGLRDDAGRTLTDRQLRDHIMTCGLPVLALPPDPAALTRGGVQLPDGRARDDVDGAGLGAAHARAEPGAPAPPARRAGCCLRAVHGRAAVA